MHCEVRSSLQAACAIGHRPLPGEGAASSPSALDQRPAYRNARCQVGCPGHPRSRYNRRGRGQLARGRERTAGLPGPGADADAAARPLHAAPPPAAHLALADAEDAAAAAQAHARAPGLRGGAAEGEGAARGAQPPHRGEHQGGRPAPPARPQIQVA